MITLISPAHDDYTDQPSPERKPMISQNLTIKIHCSECRLYFGLIQKFIKITSNDFDEATDHITQDSKKIFTHKCQEVSKISALYAPQTICDI